VVVVEATGANEILQLLPPDADEATPLALGASFDDA
jgi:hypothetical protein